MMKKCHLKASFTICTALVAAALVAHADTFTIERNDPRPFRIHRGPDETAATKAMIDELARHRPGQQRIWNEKPPRPEVCLNLDIRQLGLGEGSCGPRTEPQYIFPIRPERWTVTLCPR